MVQTRGKSTFQKEFPLFHALSSGDAAAAAALCTPQEVAKCGPGGLSAVMLALLLDADELLPQLVAAGAPLDATLRLRFQDGEMHKWLAAAQLTDRAVFRQQLVSHSTTALELAMSLGKLEPAKLLIRAGAGLEPLLMRSSYFRGYPFFGQARAAIREQLIQHAFSHFSGPNLSSAPAAVLGPLAQLALQGGRADTCLAAMEAAKGSVQYQELRNMFLWAAGEGKVQVVMHIAQHYTRRIWPLLEQVGCEASFYITQLHHTVSAELFPYLVQQFESGKLDFPYPGCFETLVRAVLRSRQPDTALELLRSKQLQQQPLLLPKSSLSTLLRTAATMGHQGLVNQLLQQGADVLCLFYNSCGYHDHCSFASSVSGLLFTHLAQQYAEGSLTVADSKQMEVLLLRAAQCNQPDACLSLLRTATNRQQNQLTHEGAAALLRATALLEQPALVLHLVEGYGLAHLWGLLGSGFSMSSTVVHAVVMHVAQKASTGALQLDSRKLALLVAKPRCLDNEACSAILTAAARQQVQLTSSDTRGCVAECLWPGFSEERAVLLLRAGAALDCSTATDLACKAAGANMAAVLAVLLDAGALIDSGVVSATIESMSCTCLEVLLQHGPLPVNTREPWHNTDSWTVAYTCPILRVMQKAKHRCYAERSLHMLELLLTAGYRPTVYRDVVVPPNTQTLVAFDPLRERSEDFAQEGEARWLWLALEHQGWRPGSHGKHPSAMKLAFTAVMLVAARGRRAELRQLLGPLSLVGDPVQSAHKRLRQPKVKTLAGKFRDLRSSAALLALLPTDVLLHVLPLAARPLSVWVGKPVS